MSEYDSKKIREDRKERARRIAGGKSEGAIDASGWSPEGETEPLNSGSQTGMKPVSKRAFKKGGKVHGKHAHHHAGRAKRKSGGALTAEGLINRNVKDANAERPGGRDHVGGYKHGGKPKKAGGGPLGGFNAVTDPTVASAVANATQNRAGVSPQRMNFGRARGGSASHPDEREDRALVDKMVKKECRTGKKDGGGKWIAGAIKHPGALHKSLHVPQGEKIPAKKLAKAEHSENPKLAKRARLAETLKHMHHCEGGRAERASGGRTGKGKMNVNIIIAQPRHEEGAMAPPGGPMPKPPGAGTAPVPVPTPGMMPGMAGGMPPGLASGAPMGGAAMQPPPQMPRKHGGRTYPIEDGAGSGEGRLEKIEAYGRNAYPGR